MNGKRIGYIRVSTVDQNPERQLEGQSLDKKFVDYASAFSVHRPQLQLMLEFIREDDNLYVHSMDRLARSISDLRKIVDIVVSKGCGVHFLKEGITIDRNKNPVGILILQIMGAFAEFELSYIRERQREGIEIAKRAGKYKGRARKINATRMSMIYERLEKTRDSKSKIAKEFGVSRNTLYKYLNNHKISQEVI